MIPKVIVCVSECCSADLRIGGEGLTHYYICTKCNNPCDSKLPEKES